MQESKAEKRSWFSAKKVVEVSVVLVVLFLAAREAYRIRLYAINTYGRVIHEFDPWFNFRATQYLADHGAAKFFTWFDYESWYPLGRPVGTTIYPGMQFTAVYIWRVLQWVGGSWAMTLNDVCVFIPNWFGALATVVLGLLTVEVSGSLGAGAAAAAVMAVVPAHLMRSIGGGYDNESVAMSAMVLTFYLWLRSLRHRSSWPIGALAGLAYFYMAAAWGGYIFVGNMVAVHAAFLVLLGRWSHSTYLAYTLWYVVGVAGATQVPVIGWAPFRSMEQLGPLAVFVGYHVLYVADLISARQGLTWRDNRAAMLRLRAYLSAVPAIVFAVLLATDWFGPLSVRVRSLFIKHTQTGNPLVDSVAEHQPASAEAYWHFLRHSLYLMPVGFVLAALKGSFTPRPRHAASPPLAAAIPQPQPNPLAHGVPVTKYFIVLYAVIAYYFASRMNRLVILMGPVASVLAGIAIDAIASWSVSQLALLVSWSSQPADTSAEGEYAESATRRAASPAERQAGKKQKTVARVRKEIKAADSSHPLAMYGLQPFIPIAKKLTAAYNSGAGRTARVVVAAVALYVMVVTGLSFWNYCDNYAQNSSHPSIMFQARLSNGQEIMVDDYREAYWWLRDNTPQDSRILSWWDYGYQITGIGNRTCLADGNTWNLEHIATLGKILTAPETKAHSLARHLADYVLIWAGNHGDDLAKSPHMARIGSSVYPDICPNDPLCYGFGFDRTGKPTPSMAASMLYKMHSNGKNGVSIDTSLFREVYTSKYGLVRIYKILNVSQESKAWCADPANRLCDHPGSWYCPGQYPPGFPKPPKTHRHINYNDPRNYRPQ